MTRARRTATSAFMSARRLPQKQDVLGYLGQEDRPFHAREVALELGVPQPSYQALVNLLDNLVLEGELTALPGGKYRLGRKRPARDGPGKGARTRATGRPRLPARRAERDGRDEESGRTREVRSARGRSA